MNNKITFYIARHGKTLMNTLDRVQGWCDSPLTDEGVEVARFLGAGFRDIEFESVYTSDLRRTRQTAQVILNEQGQAHLPIMEKEGFREACFGSYESGANLTMWREAALYLHYANPNDMYKDIFDGKISSENVLNAIAEMDTMGIAEGFDQLQFRTQKTLSEIAQLESQKNKDLNILVIAHGMSILGMLLNLGGKELLRTHLENASVCKVIYQNDKFIVEAMGDIKYVERGRKLKENE